MRLYKGKVAIVTGASSGIGAAIAKMLLKGGMKVVGLARRKERIENLLRNNSKIRKNLFALRVDVMSEKEIVEAFKWVTENLGPLSVLVNCAGIARPGTIISGKMEDFKATLDTNLLAVAITAREAIAVFKKFKIVNGYIININSIAGHYVFRTPTNDLPFYTASKFALNALGKSLRFEVQGIKGFKIRTCSINPGVVDTEIHTHVAGKEKGKQFLKITPHLSSNDLAETVRFLLSTSPTVEITDLTIRPYGELY